MSATQKAKRKVIQELQRTYTKGSELVIDLYIAGDDTAAESARRKNRKLIREIDDLIAQLFEEWAGNARVVAEDGRKRNQRLQAAIRDIRKNIKVAERIIKAIGLIDEAISTAKSLVAPL